MSMALWMYFWDEADWVQAAAPEPDQLLQDIARFSLLRTTRGRFQTTLNKKPRFATIRDDTSNF